MKYFWGIIPAKLYDDWVLLGFSCGVSKNSRTLLTKSNGLKGLGIIVFDGSRIPKGASSLSG